MTASTAVHSNAFNFLSFIQTGVDPRTGQYTCAISLPELKANDLCGPVVPLSLAFNPLNTRDSGYGKGWNLQLSQFDPALKILSLHTGETFKVNPTSTGNEPEIPERKLLSFRFFDLGNNRYRVVHKSGLVEVLVGAGGGDIALPEEMLSPQGHRVTLSHGHFQGTRYLREVRQADGRVLLSVQRDADVAIRIHPGTAFEALFTLHLGGNDNRVQRISLPTENRASWHFKYDYINQSGLLCVTEVDTPTGAKELISYDSVGHLHPFPGRPALPRVRLHQVFPDPAPGKAPIETRYSYSSNAHNFLGYNSGLQWSDDGLDNLYKVLDPYAYGSTETLMSGGTELRTITRTFNRFHLITEELTVQRDNALRNTTVYHANDELPFSAQPPKCQLPKTVTRTWYHPSQPSRNRSEVETSDFDEHGNQILQIEANGITLRNTWHSADGQGDDCPPDPWGFVRQQASETVTPAAGEPGAPTLRTDYRYSQQPPLAGATTPWLARSEETLSQVDGAQPVVLQAQRYSYINRPGDALQHGRPLREALTLNGKSTFTDYVYHKDQFKDPVRKSRGPSPYADAFVLRTQSTLTTDFDDVRHTFTEEHSLLSGEPLLERDDKNLEVAYRYNLLGQTIEEIAAPGTDVEASRYYTYFLAAVAGQQAWQSATDVKNVVTRSYFDGLNQVIRETRQDPDHNPDPEYFRDIYSALYNVFNQLYSTTEYDWLDGRNQLNLTRVLTYDDWGELRTETGPDGVVRHTLNNPIDLTQSHWLQGTDGQTSEHSRTTLNLFQKPVKIERLAPNEEQLSEEISLYDGVGNCVSQRNTMDHVSLYSYDARSRLVQTTLPDFTRIVQTYAPHSAEELTNTITVHPGNEDLASVLIGKQEFDGLDRTIETLVGNRSYRNCYKEGQLQLWKKITPGNRVFENEYDLGLSAYPKAIRILAPETANADEQTTRFVYDPAAARLTESHNAEGQRKFQYDLAGHLRTEQWIEASRTFEITYTHSLGGRQLTRTDVNQLTTEHTYDAHGRLEAVKQGKLQGTFAYDTFGRLQRSTTTDDPQKPSKLVSTREYDHWGRETKRVLTLEGQAPVTLLQYYQADDKLESREQFSGETLVLRESFQYDPCGRMEQCNYEGSGLPTDRYDNAYTKQVFIYDHLNNLVTVISTFADGSRDDCERTFSSEDPCQLVGVTHTREGYEEVSLEYDVDGHLTRDDQGQSLEYDLHGRLAGVKAADGTVLASYRYDAHDQLFGASQGGAETLRFYEGDRLSCSIQGSQRLSYLYNGDEPLGQQEVADDALPLLLFADASHSILGESQAGTVRRTVYNAYGERSNREMTCLLGFNGEVRDPVSGWYLLGNGYRAYNPWLMCFHSPDSMSPFGAGGINAYMYCAGDPINYRDPTGHFVTDRTKNLITSGGGAAFTIVSTVLSFGPLGVLGWISIAATLISTASSIISQQTDRQATKQMNIVTQVFAGIAMAASIFSYAPGVIANRVAERPLTHGLKLHFRRLIGRKKPKPKVATNGGTSSAAADSTVQPSAAAQSPETNSGLISNRFTNNNASNPAVDLSAAPPPPPAPAPAPASTSTSTPQSSARSAAGPSTASRPPIPKDIGQEGLRQTNLLKKKGLGLEHIDNNNIRRNGQRPNPVNPS
jgi:RHS repeat-associated protein